MSYSNRKSGIVRSSSRVKDLQRLFEQESERQPKRAQQENKSDDLPALVRDHAVKKDYRKPVFHSSIPESSDYSTKDRKSFPHRPPIFNESGSFERSEGEDEVAISSISTQTNIKNTALTRKLSYSERSTAIALGRKYSRTSVGRSSSFSPPFPISPPSFSPTSPLPPPSFSPTSPLPPPSFTSTQKSIDKSAGGGADNKPYRTSYLHKYIRVRGISEANIEPTIGTEITEDQIGQSQVSESTYWEKRIAEQQTGVDKDQNVEQDPRVPAENKIITKSQSVEEPIESSNDSKMKTTLSLVPKEPKVYLSNDPRMYVDNEENKKHKTTASNDQRTGTDKTPSVYLSNDPRMYIGDDEENAENKLKTTASNEQRTGSDKTASNDPRMYVGDDEETNVVKEPIEKAHNKYRKHNDCEPKTPTMNVESETPSFTQESYVNLDGCRTSERVQLGWRDDASNKHTQEMNAVSGPSAIYDIPANIRQSQEENSVNDEDYCSDQNQQADWTLYDTPKSTPVADPSPWRTIKPLEYVGFSRLPDQIYRKAVRVGFELNVLVLGEPGVGKNSLINSLFKANIGGSKYHQNEMVEGLRRSEVCLRENEVNLKLRLVELPGFAANIDNRDCWKPIVDYLDSQFIQYMKQENSLLRSSIVDHRPHVCLYFIPPTGHGLRQLDVEIIKAIHEKVNIVPLLAKADSFTIPELSNFRSEVVSDLNLNNISTFSEPLAMIGGEMKSATEGFDFLERSYPWGTINIQKEEYCDFSKLRNILLRERTLDLIERTHNVIYQTHRANLLTSLNYAQVMKPTTSELDRIRTMQINFDQILNAKVGKRQNKLYQLKVSEEEKYQAEMGALQEEKRKIDEKRRQLQLLKQDHESSEQVVLGTNDSSVHNQRDISRNIFGLVSTLRRTKKK